MKRWTVVALIALITVAAASNRDKITLQLLTAGLGKMMGQDATSQFVDGLHLGLCGAGGPLPAPKASGPCIVVTAGERHFVFDAGTDGVRNLIRMGYPVGRIEAVFLTHFHSDHIDGLGSSPLYDGSMPPTKHPCPSSGQRALIKSLPALTWPINSTPSTDTRTMGTLSHP